MKKSCKPGSNLCETPFIPPLTANRTVGALGGIVASRIAREFKVGGAGITISAEESSGLQALNVAVQALQRKELDHALVGAVDLIGDIRSLLTTHAYTPFSETGDVRPFDEHADGSLPGEGAAAVVLKRLDDAVRDGNRIYAVLNGIGKASGGKLPFCADPQAYLQALARAGQQAQSDPASIQYFEAHGSGIPREDQVEAEVFANSFLPTPSRLPGGENGGRERESCCRTYGGCVRPGLLCQSLSLSLSGDHSPFKVC